MKIEINPIKSLMQLQVNMSQLLRTWHDILLLYYVFIFSFPFYSIFFLLAGHATIRDRMVDRSTMS